jgi:hypothetical protein
MEVFHGDDNWQRAQRRCLDAESSEVGTQGAWWLTARARSGANLGLVGQHLVAPSRVSPCSPMGGTAGHMFVGFFFSPTVDCLRHSSSLSRVLSGCKIKDAGAMPKVLMLTRAMAMWLAWCLPICFPCLRCGHHLGGVPCHVWVVEIYAKRKLSPWIFPGHDGGVHGCRYLLEGVVAASP